MPARARIPAWTLLAAALLVVLVVLLAFAAAVAGAHHRGPVPITDDPAVSSDAPTGLAALGHAAARREPAVRSRAQAIPRRARNLELIGALKLDPANAGAHGDVAGFRDLAFVGKWSGAACPGTGVDIIDIAAPRSPRKVGDTIDHANTSMEDMEAMRVGGRDVLAVGLQDCGAEGVEPGMSALELHDITDPADPQVLSVFTTDAGGVHELDLARTRDGRTLALLTVPGQEALTSDELGLGGLGDVLIVDITDPRRPLLLSDFGVLDEPALGLDLYLGARQGADARTYGHSVRANADATLAYLSYWDSGVLTVDISDPRDPVFLGRTSFTAGEEGNAHSVDEARGGDVLVQADEDYTPFRPSFTSTAFAGERGTVDAQFSPPLSERPGRELTGETVHVGRGCPAGAVAPGSPADPYLGDPAGKIALVERGGCRFDLKVARAQLAGAVGVIVYNTAAGGEELVLMGGTDPVIWPDGTSVDLSIPAVFVARSTGELLRDAAAPTTIRLALEFDGWGFLRFFDNRDPANPRRLSQFATANTLNPAVASEGWFTVHNPQVRGNRLYASWYADGIRMLDIATIAFPREVGYWTGAGAPADAPAVDIWGVAPHRRFLLASDRNYGLYILRDTYLQPTGADPSR